MKTLLERINNLFKEPEYRTKLLVFVLIGVVLTLSAILTQDEFWSDVLVQIAITFATVAFVQVLWAFLGGDPVEVEIGQAGERLEGEIQAVDQKVDHLKGSLNLLADLMDGNIGIERIWPDRNAWQTDQKDGRDDWHKWVCQADEINFVSNTMWNNWLHNDDFRRGFFENLNRGANIKIVLYDPDSPILAQRAKDEKDPKLMGVLQMQNEIGSSLLVISKELGKLEPQARERLEVRLSDQFAHFAQIIRADKRVLVALYLSGRTGGYCPTFQLQGDHSVYYETYEKQFEIIWKRAKAISQAELQELVGRFEGMERPPVEG
jgi:hypothetical protein